MEIKYTAVTESGIKQKGILEASNEKEVIEYLRSNHLIPVLIQKKSASAIPFFGRVTKTDVILFTRQLSSIILAGLTLLEGLEILKKQTTKPQMRKVIDDIISSISEGQSFSQALTPHRTVFSDVYISLIKAAESSGLLDKILERLANNLEKIDDLKKKVKGALFYPFIVLIAVAIVLVIMNVLVIPQLGKLYSSLNIQLPLTTQFVLWFSKFFNTFYPLLIPFGIGFFFLFKRMQKTDLGEKTFDRIKLKTPVLGNVVELTILDEVTRTLSLLIGAGTSILEALNITKNVAGNVWYKKAIQSTTELVEKGIPLSEAFEQQKIFPPIVISMTKVGETTGKIDENLLRVSEYFERDLDVKVKALTSAIEPLLVVILGLIVGFIILSVITPIYSLISQIQ